LRFFVERWKRLRRDFGIVRVQLLVSGILEGQVEAMEAMEAVEVVVVVAVEAEAEVQLLPRIGEIALAVTIVLVV
jgi:hypothetical protein